MAGKETMGSFFRNANPKQTIEKPSSIEKYGAWQNKNSERVNKHNRKAQLDVSRLTKKADVARSDVDKKYSINEDEFSETPMPEENPGGEYEEAIIDGVKVTIEVATGLGSDGNQYEKDEMGEWKLAEPEIGGEMNDGL